MNRSRIPAAFGIPVLLMLCVLVASCAWEIFTAGHVDTSRTLVQGQAAAFDREEFPVLLVRVGAVLSAPEYWDDWEIVVLSPYIVDPPVRSWAPVPEVLEDSTWAGHRFELVDDELIELVEIEVGELLENASPFRMFWFQMREPE